jgi:hypothetical protein
VLRHGLRLRLVDPHQVLLAATRLEALEVAADRGAHVVEMALFAHGEGVPDGGRDSFRVSSR